MHTQPCLGEEKHGKQRENCLLLHQISPTFRLILYKRFIGKFIIIAEDKFSVAIVAKLMSLADFRSISYGAFTALFQILQTVIE